MQLKEQQLRKRLAKTTSKTISRVKTKKTKLERFLNCVIYDRVTARLRKTTRSDTEFKGGGCADDKTAMTVRYRVASNNRICFRHPREERKNRHFSNWKKKEEERMNKG